MRRRGRVDQNQPCIVEALRKVGCIVEVISDIGRGVPDLMVYSPRLPGSGLLLLEVKMPGEGLTLAEKNWHARWAIGVRIVHSVAEALIAVGVEAE